MSNILDKKNQEIITLKKELERLAEENTNFETINKSHKEINGELQPQLSAAELKIKQLEIKLKEQVNQFRNKGEL